MKKTTSRTTPRKEASNAPPRANLITGTTGAVVATPARRKHRYSQETKARTSTWRWRRLGRSLERGRPVYCAEVIGFDPREAEVIIGTSAGSVLASLIGGGVRPRQLRDHQLGVPITAKDRSRDSPGTTNAPLRNARAFLGSLGRVRQAAAFECSTPAPDAPDSGSLRTSCRRGRVLAPESDTLWEAITPVGEWSPTKTCGSAR